MIIKNTIINCYKVKPCGRTLALNGQNNVVNENLNKNKNEFLLQ
jgi:hypothetical protein